MRLSLVGYYRNLRSHLFEAQAVLKDNNETLSHAAYEDIELGLQEGLDGALVLIEIIFALLKQDISREEAIDFFAIKEDDLKIYKYTNDLIIFEPKASEKENA